MIIIITYCVELCSICHRYSTSEIIRRTFSYTAIHQDGRFLIPKTKTYIVRSASPLVVLVGAVIAIVSIVSIVTIVGRSR